MTRCCFCDNRDMADVEREFYSRMTRVLRFACARIFALSLGLNYDVSLFRNPSVERKTFRVLRTLVEAIIYYNIYPVTGHGFGLSGGPRMVIKVSP